MKHILILLSALLLCPLFLAAQTRREALLEYQARRRQAYTEFRDNYRKACADFMRRRWEAFRSETPVPVPERKEPDVPISKAPDAPAAPTRDRLPFGKEIESPRQTAPAPNETQPADEPAPAQPEAPRIDSKRPCRFLFYGTACSASLDAGHRISLVSTEENRVADAWERIAGGNYDKVVTECKTLKKQLRLNDWGYYELVRALSDTFCGKDSNESVLLQSFLMAEAGYKIRLARSDRRLHLLLAFDGTVYARPFFKIDNEAFYPADDSKRGATYHICGFSIPGERALSLALPELPALAHSAGTAVRRDDDKGGIHTTVTPDRNLVAFMAGYPQCAWNVYAATRLSAATRTQLLPPLRLALEGKTQRQAAEILLRYLHRAFPYKTDDDQFGAERTFFAEEMFCYPYSDCEDRSILYVQLVKELLGLKAVLLYYPNHISAAVRFTESVQGDYIQLGSERYVVCDPTYLGAGIGECMPQYKKVSAQIIRIE